MKKLLKITAWIAGLIVAVPMAFVIGMFLFSDWAKAPEPTPPTAQEIADARIAQLRSTARYMCRDLIEGVLNNPASAEWGMNSGNWYLTWPAQLDGNIVTVQPQFRATNGFGATIVTRWSCEIEITETETRLIDLQEL